MKLPSMPLSASLQNTCLSQWPLVCGATCGRSISATVEPTVYRKHSRTSIFVLLGRPAARERVAVHHLRAGQSRPRYGCTISVFLCRPRTNTVIGAYRKSFSHFDKFAAVAAVSYNHLEKGTGRRSRGCHTAAEVGTRQRLMHIRVEPALYSKLHGNADAH